MNNGCEELEEEKTFDDDIQEVTDDDIQEFLDDDIQELIESDIQEFIENDLQELIESDLQELIENDIQQEIDDDDTQEEIDDDTQRKNKDEDNNIYSNWDQLPDILLEEIFISLSIKERYYASLVCKNWYRAFKLPNVWSTFTLSDNTMVRGRFNYYSGWQFVLDHLKTSTCLNKFGRHFKCLIFEPMMNFYNLYEFMNMISWYCERHGQDNKIFMGLGNNIQRLKFTFPCNMSSGGDNSDVIKLFGTGGKLLEALKRLMRNLENIKSLELVDLMLDNLEAIHLMDDICANCTQTLTKLVLINATKVFCPLLHVGVFLNLRTLYISPQSIHDEVIELLGYTKISDLHIVQNRYSPKQSTLTLPKNKCWKKMKLVNPRVKVHFEIESQKSSDIMLTFNTNEYHEIPCYSIVLDNPNTQISSTTVLSHAVNFGKTLHVYALKGITKHYLQKVFAKRLDESILKLCKLCPNLHTLMIRYKLSTATLLEIMSIAKSLRFLYVRRNVILKKCDADLLNISDWSAEHYKWIKENCNSYEKTEQEISRILGYRWHMLSEKEFHTQTLNLHV